MTGARAISLMGFPFQFQIDGRKPILVRIPAKLTAESDDDDRVESRGAWCSDFSLVGHHRG
jgi:hypothetical protein